MNKAMLQLVVRLLRLASEEFDNHGCNDFELTDTPENSELARRVEESDGHEGEFVVSDGKIYITDSSAMAFCADKIEEELGLPKGSLKP